MKGRKTAPAAKTHRHQLSMTTTRTKQMVRIVIVNRYRRSRRAWSSVRDSGALVTDCASVRERRVVGISPLYVRHPTTTRG